MALKPASGKAVFLRRSQEWSITRMSAGKGAWNVHSMESLLKARQRGHG
ncbi:hypothetical protein ACFO3J_32385 [Streptomyces polygonati]|uniref:DUF397 domain-containing protein n=1 Tax=Streptomyces polygonati TaxID=1617087 RepID=A0ABV8HZ35_9ACTN